MHEDWETDWAEEDRLKKEYYAKMKKQRECKHEQVVRKGKPGELMWGYDYVVECPKCEEISWIHAFVGDYIVRLQQYLDPTSDVNN